MPIWHPVLNIEKDGIPMMQGHTGIAKLYKQKIKKSKIHLTMIIFFGKLDLKLV